MSVSNALRRIAAVVDGVEAEDVEVRDAAMPTDRPVVSDGKVHVTLDLAIALEGVGGEHAEGSERASADREQDDQAAISGIVSEATETNPPEPTSGATQHSSDSQRSPSGKAEDERAGDDAQSRAVEVEPATEQSDDGAVVCPEPGCDATFESEPGMKIHRTKIHLREQSGDDSSTATPAYRDPEALEEVYEAHDSFPAMREALDVDVSAQTIRRHMIQHGIHDPSGDGEANEHAADGEDDVEAAAEPESTTDSESARASQTTHAAVEDADDRESDEQPPENAVEKRDSDDEDTEASDDDQSADEAETDDEPTIPESAPLAETLPEQVTAPADVTFAELKEAVRTADTLYHIQQQFGLTREEARDLLGSLDLLELVHGRVATKHEREELKAEIDSRIRHNIRGNGTSA
ncbi:hypothetical protein ACFR9U_17810 [Halorientalis brevis]|uniref:C2H2-type domain-containing protein n=1 Tax=Halorientalis brevis TaxID=1126241 RepID=A0ABD6CHV5_9EURY|nr:hypothetical protein [Halorientalis brevis]